MGGVISAGGGPFGPGSKGGGEGRRTSRAGSLASSQAAAAWAALGPAAGRGIGKGTGWDAPGHDHQSRPRLQALQQTHSNWAVGDDPVHM